MRISMMIIATIVVLFSCKTIDTDQSAVQTSTDNTHDMRDVRASGSCHHSSPETCEAESGCRWIDNNTGCISRCKLDRDEETCVRHGCRWIYGKRCVDHCSYHNAQSTCLEDTGCSWNNDLQTSE